MRLSLSSAAAPDAALADLLAACARRGFTALELVEGNAHGIGAGLPGADRESERARAGVMGVEICGIYRESPNLHDLEPAARLAAELDVPLVLPARTLTGALLSRVVDTVTATGARMLLAHDSEPRTVETLRRDLASTAREQVVGLAWEVRPEQDDPALWQEVLTAAGARLRYIRLHGGGPETIRQSGRGVGEFMARLALARYAGPLVLTPSTSSFHYAWRAWLGRAGGWGCGSKQPDAGPLPLKHATPQH